MEALAALERPSSVTRSEPPGIDTSSTATFETAPEESEVETYQETRQRIVRLDQIWDKKKRRFRFESTRKRQDREEKLAKYVVTVVRRISNHGTFEGHYLVKIRGSYILEALSAAYHDVEEITFAEPISLDTSNLQCLYYALPSLVKALDKEKSKVTPNEKKIFELGATVMFIQEHFQKTFQTLDELPEGQISFENIWVLFPYHCLVYSPDKLGQPRAYRVRYSDYKTKNGTSFFLVEADYIDSDGKSFGYVSKRPLPLINDFSGSMLIRDLPFYPLDLAHDTSQGLVSQLLKSGNKAIELKGRHLLEYRGHAITEEDDKQKKFNSHGRIMIDPVVFDEIIPRNAIVPIIHDDLCEASLTDHQKLLINPLVYGFSFGDKIWGAFAISKLEKVKWNESLADALVLSQDRKNFIRSLVKHYSGSDRSECLDDFVQDKGKGLIGLLAGPPGVGKTLTAEAVAEIAHRPLYTMTSGELGDSSKSVQKQLLKVFELAERWKAVILLDEADVFLTERSDTSLSSNAITSIFLRHLEYYQGILLLTTNRFLSLDKAFQSRIHFSFKFEELSDEARQAIWRGFLARTHVNLGDEDLSKLSKIKLNGRQIKNIANISYAVARENNTKVTMESIMRTVEFTNITWKEGDPSDRQYLEKGGINGN